MDRRDLLLTVATVAGADALTKATAWAFPELNEVERYAVWLATGVYDGQPVADVYCDTIPDLLARGYLEVIEVAPDSPMFAECKTTCVATTKGKRALDRLGFDNNRKAMQEQAGRLDV